MNALDGMAETPIKVGLMTLRLLPDCRICDREDDSATCFASHFVTICYSEVATLNCPLQTRTKSIEHSTEVDII